MPAPASMSDDADTDDSSDGSVPGLVNENESDDEDLVSDSSSSSSSSSSVSTPWRLCAACDWASFADRLLLRQELRDKHYMMRKSQKCSKLTFRSRSCRHELRQECLHPGCPRHGICVTQFCPGHGKGHIDQLWGRCPGQCKGQTYTDTIMGRLPITRWHCGRLLWGLAKGHHALSKTCRLKHYLN
jgi:hypothetical protein